METRYSIKNFSLSNGERYCLLIDSLSHFPLFCPNLYITTQVRNRSFSLSAMNSALGGICVLLQFMDSRGMNLEERFRKKDYLGVHELDAIRDFCQKRFRSTDKNHQTLLPICGKTNERVSKDFEYTRLTSIALYIDWLASYLVAPIENKSVLQQINKMVDGLKSRRPPKGNKSWRKESRSLDEKQIDLIFEIFRPESELNPFKNYQVKIRNRLIFLMLYHLGLRGGELLSIRVRDLDFSKNQLVVVRRPDEKDDTRTYQPLVKTLDRRLPLKETLAREIHSYIVKIRRGVPNANKHDFLFVTHKEGPTQGQPISIVSYKKMMRTVRSAAPDLYNLTGHQLRHTWNDNFSKHMDSMDRPPSEEKQEQIRSYLMGWRAGSGTAAVYNKRFIQSKAEFASLKLQEGLLRKPDEEEED